jgi:hypothetical protein
MLDLDNNFMLLPVRLHFHDQEQVSLQTLLQRLVPSDKFFFNNGVIPDADIRVIMREELLYKCGNQPLEQRVVALGILYSFHFSLLSGLKNLVICLVM